VRAAQPRRGLTGVLDRLPGHLEHEAVLRVDVSGLAWRDPEKCRIELVDPVEEATDRLHGRVGEQRGGIPAPGGHGTYRVAARHEHGPEAVDVRRPGEPPSHSDDGDQSIWIGMRVECRHGRPHVNRGGKSAGSRRR
jgi:hypothetical protein